MERTRRVIHHGRPGRLPQQQPYDVLSNWLESPAEIAALSKTRVPSQVSILKTLRKQVTQVTTNQALGARAWTGKASVFLLLNQAPRVQKRSAGFRRRRPASVPPPPPPPQKCAHDKWHRVTEAAGRERQPWAIDGMPVVFKADHITVLGPQLFFRRQGHLANGERAALLILRESCANGTVDVDDDASCVVPSELASSPILRPSPSCRLVEGFVGPYLTDSQRPELARCGHVMRVCSSQPV